MGRITKFILAVALTAGFSGLALPAFAADPQPLAGVIDAAASVDDFTFDSVHVDYTLSAGSDGTGDLTVVETYVANFTHDDTHRGMRRILPTTFNDAPLQPHLVSITDENGEEREQDSETEDDSFLMTSRASDYVTGKQTYVFTYTITNVARAFADEDVDEFYWDVVGAEWAQPFDDVSMTLTVDPELAGSLNGAAACYVGGPESEDRCDLTVNDGDFTMSPVSLQPHEGVTIAVGFESGTFTAFDGSYLSNPLAPVHMGFGAIGLLGIIGTVVARRTGLKDAPGRGVIVAQYEPPAGVDAMNAAVMLQKPHLAVTAEILEQAVRGSIQIRELEEKRGTFVLRLVDQALAGDENGKHLLETIFGKQGSAGDEVNLADSPKVGQKLSVIPIATAKEQMDGGVRRKPPRSLSLWVPLALFALASVPVVIGFVMASRTNNPTGVLLGIGGVVIAIVCTVLLNKRPFTDFGADLRDHLAGLKQFISWAEADRIRMLQSPAGAERIRVNTNDAASVLRLYEPLLPFAVAFGMEKQWVKNMQFYYDAGGYSPVWYVGHAPFSAASLSAATSSFASASAGSSSSGGSSGGGSVGGGGGGGGGGGV